MEYENTFNLNFDSPANIGISFLVNQHIFEVLEQARSAEEAVDMTFTKEFMSMMQVCIFVPYLHEETPKPIRIPKSELKLDYLRPDINLLESVLRLRQNIVDKLSGQPSLDQKMMMNIHHQLLMNNIPE